MMSRYNFRMSFLRFIYLFIYRKLYSREYKYILANCTVTRTFVTLIDDVKTHLLCKFDWSKANKTLTFIED